MKIEFEPLIINYGLLIKMSFYHLLFVVNLFVMIHNKNFDVIFLSFYFWSILSLFQMTPF